MECVALKYAIDNMSMNPTVAPNPNPESAPAWGGGRSTDGLDKQLGCF